MWGYYNLLPIVLLTMNSEQALWKVECFKKKKYMRFISTSTSVEKIPDERKIRKNIVQWFFQINILKFIVLLLYTSHYTLQPSSGTHYSWILIFFEEWDYTDLILCFLSHMVFCLWIVYLLTATILFFLYSSTKISYYYIA